MPVFFSDNNLRVPVQPLHPPLGASPLLLDVIEWSRGSPKLKHRSDEGFDEHMRKCQSCDVRIVFTELDLVRPEAISTFQQLFHHYSIPLIFDYESDQSLVFSFGHGEDFIEPTAHKIEYSWLRSLYKHVAIYRAPDGTGLEIKGERFDSMNGKWNRLSNSSYAWYKSAYFLTCPQDSSATDAGGITLICFGAPKDDLKRYFEDLLVRQSASSRMLDAYVLYTPILYALHRQFDTSAWNVTEMIGDIEGRTLERAKDINRRDNAYDFVGLHNIAKHVIYMLEGADGALESIKTLIDHHSQSHTADSHVSMELRYLRRLFASTRLRLVSGDRRVQNTITLAYNTIAQEDTRLAQEATRLSQAHSTSVQVIATVTLFFLPATAIATICSSAFFDFTVDPLSGAQRMTVSRYFWVFWVIAIGLTAIVMAGWLLYSKWKVENMGLRGEKRVRGAWIRALLGRKKVTGLKHQS